ncbi:MAG: hypothetical protein H3C30_09230 [Candidatus Hydrogenedentes bacterium]|nr:hypothetical protein [Candidatus Hydrogenedentota bacterium]
MKTSAAPMNRSGVLLFGALSAVIMASGCGPSGTTGPHAHALKPDTVVAEVDGQPIYYREIVQSGGTQNEPANLSREELRLRKVHREANTLRMRIEGLLREHEWERLGATLSDEDIEKQQKVMYSAANVPDEMFGQIAVDLKAVAQALHEALDKKADPGELYEKHLKNTSIDRERWEMLRLYYDTPEKIDKLRIPVNAEEARNAGRGAVAEEVKFIRVVDAIAGSTVTAHNYSRLMEKRQQIWGDWVREQYRKGRVKVTSPEHKVLPSRN